MTSSDFNTPCLCSSLDSAPVFRIGTIPWVMPNTPCSIPSSIPSTNYRSPPSPSHRRSGVTSPSSSPSPCPVDNSDQGLFLAPRWKVIQFHRMDLKDQSAPISPLVSVLLFRPICPSLFSIYPPTNILLS